MVGLGKPQLHVKFEVVSFSHYTNIKGDPQILGTPLAQFHVHLFSLLDFIMGLDKLQRLANIEVASFSRCRDIVGEHQNIGELP